MRFNRSIIFPLLMVWLSLSWSLPVSLAQTAPLAATAADKGLLQSTDFEYVGAFRLPRGKFGGSRFGYSGGAIAINANQPEDPEDDTIFFSGHAWNTEQVAEIAVPAIVKSETLKDLNTSQVVQPFADITDGKIGQIESGNAIRLAGLLVDKDRILWTALHYYDAAHAADRSHGISGKDLSDTNDAQGIFRVGTINPGFVAGYMANVPRQWQTALGSKVIAGQSNVPIITRTSAGPAAIGFDPAQLQIEKTAPATVLLANGYTDVLETKNDAYNFNSTVGGIVFPAGFGCVVYFGSHGTGEVCYGTGEHCNDTQDKSKGWHDRGGHYIYQAWAYNVDDLVAVKQGRLEHDAVRPYAIWSPTFSFASGRARIGGVTYDEHSNRAFVVQMEADRGIDGSEEPQPLVHVYQLPQRHRRAISQR